MKAISLREEILTDGNSPIKVIAENYRLYVAKNSKSKDPATDIINEVLAYYFLNLWDIPTPPAALINIDAKMLLEEYQKAFHKPSYYKKPVFGSEWIDAADCNTFFSVPNRHEYKKFNNPEILFQIGLFDIWVENDDRKPSNNNLLIRSVNGKQNIIPIDHSFIFSTMAYKDLKPGNFSPIHNENLFITELGVSLKTYKWEFDNWLENDRERFYLYIKKCEENYTKIVKNIPISWGFTLECQRALYEFLFNKDRNKQVFDEYIYKMS